MGQKVSKNIYYSINGHALFGHNSAIFWPIGLKFFVRTRETIIYRLLVRNQCNGDQFQISNFWALIGGKMGVATTSVPKDPGPKTRPKSWPTLGPFWVICYLKIILPNFLTLDPPPLILKHNVLLGNRDHRLLFDSLQNF